MNNHIRNSISNFVLPQTGIMMQDNWMKTHLIHMIAVCINYIIHFSLTACNIAKDCYTCLSQDDSFDCKWCQKVRRCSDGIDWLRQEWRDQGCEIQVNRGLFPCCHISVHDSILIFTHNIFWPKYAYK